MRGLHGADEPFPEANRLRVWIVHAEGLHAVADPELDDALHLQPERAWIVADEVDGIDVLILLRRILRVLDRSVGAVEEPLWMLVHPWMIGRCLDGAIERDLQATALCRLHEPVEVVERAEVGMHGGVAALGAADRPRAAGIAGLRGERVVAALTVRAADRVDRRQVHDVEAHGGGAIELRLGVLQRAVPAITAAAREEFVPGGEARTLAVGDDLELP